ncbi:MAG: HEPN domain-containing protein [Chloroflexota bacterium]
MPPEGPQPPEDARPGEDARTYLTRQWLVKARHDLIAAERLSQSAPLPDITAFHCQQAAEKALKAYLAWQNEPFRKTHNLRELVQQCVSLDGAFTELQEAGHKLSEYGVDSRYPGPFSEPTPEEAEEALRLASHAFEFVLSHLPPDLRS